MNVAPGLPRGTHLATPFPRFPVASIEGRYEYDDDDPTPDKKKEGGLHQNLFDSEGNLNGSARFSPDEGQDDSEFEPVFAYEPVYVYDGVVAAVAAPDRAATRWKAHA